MSELEAWGLAYLLGWTIAGHLFAGWAIKLWWKHRKRSIAAQKAAGTRKKNARMKGPRPLPTGPKPRTRPSKKPKPMPEDRVVMEPSAWFMPLGDDEEDQPDYNEVDLSQWRPEVRRFNGGAHEYAARDDRDGSV